MRDVSPMDHRAQAVDEQQNWIAANHRQETVRNPSIRTPWAQTSHHPRQAGLPLPQYRSHDCTSHSRSSDRRHCPGNSELNIIDVATIRTRHRNMVAIRPVDSHDGHNRIQASIARPQKMSAHHNKEHCIPLDASQDHIGQPMTQAAQRPDDNTSHDGAPPDLTDRTSKQQT